MPGHSLIPVLTFREQMLCPNNPYRSPDKAWQPDKAGKNDGTPSAVQWQEPCAASPRAREIYRNILDEVMAIFPSPFIHLGGDEYFGQAWEQCPDCQRVVETEHLRDGDNPRLRELFAHCLGSKQKYLLYRWWVSKMCDFVRSRGRWPVLWDDLSWEGKYPRDAVVMQWHYQGGRDAYQQVDTPNNPAAEAALLGHDTIMVPFSHLYLDHDSTLADVYRLSLVPAGMPLNAQRHFWPPCRALGNGGRSRGQVRLSPHLCSRRNWLDTSRLPQLGRIRRTTGPPSRPAWAASEWPLENGTTAIGRMLGVSMTEPMTRGTMERLSPLTIV